MARRVSHISASVTVRPAESHVIESHWSDAEQLVLDFDGVRVGSVSFFDESFEMLAKQHSIDDLTKRIKVENIDHRIAHS